MKSKNLIIPEQSGFSHQGSTINNTIKRGSHIQEAFANNQNCIGVYFKIYKAFDSSWRHENIGSFKTGDTREPGKHISLPKNVLHNPKFHKVPENYTS